jgi:cell division protein FtsL
VTQFLDDAGVFLNYQLSFSMIRFILLLIMVVVLLVLVLDIYLLSLNKHLFNVRKTVNILPSSVLTLKMKEIEAAFAKLS